MVTNSVAKKEASVAKKEAGNAIRTRDRLLGKQMLYH